MKHFALADVLDVLFYTVSAWFLSLGLLRYFRVQTGVALACSTLIAAAAGVLIALLLFSRRKKAVLGKRERELKDKLMLHLALEREERVRAALLRAMLSDGKKASCERDAIAADGELFVPLFTMQPLSADAVAALLKTYGSEPFTLLCNELTPEAERLLAVFGKKTMHGGEVFSLFLRSNSMPEPLICGELPRRTAKQKLQRTFAKKNARPFFVCGLSLLVMSLFALFPLYYLITGAILLLSAVFVRAFGYA